MKTNVNLRPRRMGVSLVVITFLFTVSSCQWRPGARAMMERTALTASTETKDETPLKTIADAPTILRRPQIPILCYHQIRDWRTNDSKRSRDYIVPLQVFREQMKMLADSGYHAILPDQLYNYLVTGQPLPSKPVMLTFDDTDKQQFTEGLVEMNKYGFKGVFFIMTVSIGRADYMTRDEIKTLSAEGHCIGSHTWDHQNVKKYTAADWKIQIEKPTRQLEEITGRPVRYFAYPFGLWNADALPELKKRGMVAAFQLSGKRNDDDPMYTIRRMIVPGSWSPGTLHRWMQSNF